MLGFSGFTETAFGESTTSIPAFADANTQLLQVAAGSLTLTAKASITLTSISAVGNVTALLFDADANTSVTTLLATTGFNGALSVSGKAGVTPSTLVSTFSTSVFSIEAKASTITSSTLSTFANPNLDISAEASITTSTVSSQSNISGISTTAAANITPSSLLLTAASPNVIPTVHAEILVGSVASETQVAPLAEIDAQANASLASILLSSGLTDFADEDAEATVVLTSLRGSLTTVLSSPTAVNFPYQDFANDYSRQRTLFLVSADTNNTVHIPADPANRTVFVQSTASNAGNRTVKIAA